MNDPYDLDIAPLNVFENQVIPVGIHNLSKSFRPNMATIRVLSLGTKFIPKWRDPNIKHTFKNFGDFNRRMQNNMFFSETSPGTYHLNKKFHLKSHFVSPETFNEVNEFCWLLRDGISDLVEKTSIMIPRQTCVKKKKEHFTLWLQRKTASMSLTTRIKILGQQMRINPT